MLIAWRQNLLRTVRHSNPSSWRMSVCHFLIVALGACCAHCPALVQLPAHAADVVRFPLRNVSLVLLLYTAEQTIVGGAEGIGRLFLRRFVSCVFLIPFYDCQRMAIVTAQEVGVTLAAEKIDATYMPEQPGSESTPSPAPL